ncbi:MAG: DMT family transporter [Coxiellaceae bacterium]|nr:DMT family transporter [Coxiellaceae bacterium]
MAYLFLVLAQLSVGVNIVGSKYLLHDVSVTFLLLVRFWVAALWLFIIYWLQPKSRRLSSAHPEKFNKTDFTYLILQALCAGALFNLLLLTGLKYTSASVAGIITSALPAMITIFSVILLRERLTRMRVLSVVLAVSGLVIINLHGFRLGGASNLKGSLIVILALLPESLYYVLCKIHLVRMPLVLLSAWINLINGIVVLPLLIVHPDAMNIHLSVSSWWVLLAVTISTAAFYLFWYMGCRGVQASLAGMFTAIMPISTLLLSWLFLSEVITLLQGVGMLLVIGSIFLYAKGKDKRI